MKNRSCAPFLEAEDVKLYFDSGIDPKSGLLLPLIKSRKIDLITKHPQNRSNRSNRGKDQPTQNHPQRHTHMKASYT